jgi:DNA modification methylase
MGRRFVLIEQDPSYVEVIRDEAKLWLGEEAQHVLTLNCPPIEVSDMLF